jgi:glutaredoxin
LNRGKNSVRYIGEEDLLVWRVVDESFLSIETSRVNHEDITNTMAQPQITLYTNHRCPYAHRAHITLEELGLPYEEVFIDLDKPREPWYLKVNPVSPPHSIFHKQNTNTISAVSSPQSNTPTTPSKMK